VRAVKFAWPSIAIVLMGSAAAAEIELPPETAVLRTSALPGYEIAAKKCVICHSSDYISLQPPGMSLRQWTAELVKMQKAFGAPIDDQELGIIAIYLTATYGDPTTILAPN
jgi:hypothetical protein